MNAKMTCLCLVVIIIISNLYPRLKKTNDPDVHNCSENFQYLNSESVRLYLFEYYYYCTVQLY